jgi:YVTN family beta-propeller protein
MKCNKCNGLQFVEQKVRFTPKVMEEIIEVTIPCMVCENCQTPLMDRQQSSVLRTASADKYRENHHLLTSSQIISCRTKLCMSQSAFATYLGVGQASIRQWETYFIQDVEQDTLIRSLSMRKQFFVLKGDKTVPGDKTTPDVPENVLSSNEGMVYAATLEALSTALEINKKSISVPDVPENVMSEYEGMMYVASLESLQEALNIEGAKVSQVLVCNYGGDSVDLVNIETSIVERFTVQDNPRDLVVNSDATMAVVANYGSASVSFIDLKSKEVTNVSIAPADKPKYIKLLHNDDNIACVACDDYLCILDLSTKTVTHTIASASNPWGLVISPDDTSALIVDYNNDRIIIIGLETFISTALDVGDMPRDLVVTNDGKAVIVCYGAGTVLVKDSGVDETINVGDNPAYVVVTTDSTKAYVSNATANVVHVIDLSTYTFVNVNVDAKPDRLLLNDDDSKLCVINKDGNSLSIIDTASNVTSSVPVGDNPIYLAVSPDGITACVANYDAPNLLTVIDIPTSMPLRTVSIGSNPQDVVVSSNNAFCVTSSLNGNNISVTNIRTGINTDISVGTTPTRMEFLA